MNIINYLYLTKEDKLDYLNYLISGLNSRINAEVSDIISQDQINMDLITLPLLLQEKEKIENE